MPDTDALRWIGSECRLLLLPFRPSSKGRGKVNIPSGYMGTAAAGSPSAAAPAAEPEKRLSSPKALCPVPAGRSACLYTGSEIPSETKSQPKDSSTKPISGSESQKKRPALLSLLQPAASGVLLQWKTDRQVQLLQFPPPHQEGIRLRCVLRKTAGTARRTVLLQA